MYMTVGSLDDRVLALTNLAELPLDPFALLSVPAVGAMVDAHLDTLGIARRPFGAIVRRGSTTLRWPGDRFRFSVIRGVGHKYPDAAPRAFWRFFRAHAL